MDLNIGIRVGSSAPSYRSLRALYVAMWGSIMMLIGMAEWMHPSTHDLGILYPVFLAASLANMAVAFFFHKVFVQASVERLRSTPGDQEALKRWGKGSLVTIAICESIVLFGFVMRFLGAGLVRSAVLYAVAVVGMLVFAPRKYE